MGALPWAHVIYYFLFISFYANVFRNNCPRGFLEQMWLHPARKLLSMWAPSTKLNPSHYLSRSDHTRNIPTYTGRRVPHKLTPSAATERDNLHLNREACPVVYVRVCACQVYGRQLTPRPTVQFRGKGVSRIYASRLEDVMAAGQKGLRRLACNATNNPTCPMVCCLPFPRRRQITLMPTVYEPDYWSDTQEGGFSHDTDSFTIVTYKPIPPPSSSITWSANKTRKIHAALKMCISFSGNNAPDQS